MLDSGIERYYELRPGEGVAEGSEAEFLSGLHQSSKRIVFRLIEEGDVIEAWQRLQNSNSPDLPWDLASQNCEHSARYVVLGRRESRQVQVWTIAVFLCLLLATSKAG